MIKGYKLLKDLGEGGMGKVILAEDEMLERKVAIKILNTELANDSQFINRFQQEAKIQAKLSHPNIVTLFNFQKEKNEYYIIMEYVVGVTLSDLIKKEGKISEKHTGEIFIQILNGMKFAHENGIVHRDIKPSNIIIKDDGLIKIMDFGIAKIVGERNLTATGVKIGTLLYMSPEQIIGIKDIDKRSDLYSLGILFYEMLTGQLPFNVNTESDYQIMDEIVKREFKDLKEVLPELSDNFVNIFEKLTASDRNNRFSDCQEVIEVIQNVRSVNHKPDTRKFEAEKTVLGIPVYDGYKRPDTILKSKRSNNLKIVLAVIIVLIVFLSVSLFFILSKNNDNNTKNDADTISKSQTDENKDNKKSNNESYDKNVNTKSEDVKKDTNNSEKTEKTVDVKKEVNKVSPPVKKKTVVKEKQSVPRTETPQPKKKTTTIEN